MNRHTITAIIILLMSCAGPGFSQPALFIPSGTILPKDTAVSTGLTQALSSFLDCIASERDHSRFITKTDQAQSQDLVDEMKDIQKSRKYESEHFYKPYLLNVSALNDSTYYIQLAMMGSMDSMPILRASFDLLAFASPAKEFKFCSPLSYHTQDWQVRSIGNVRFHFRNEQDIAHAKAYCSYVSHFDKKLGNHAAYTDYYCCRTAIEALHILGVSYKSDYNGRRSISLNATDGHTTVNVTGPNQLSTFDPHDLWHSRLQKAMPKAKIYRPVDEGCAYLYGGSWGMSWQEIYRLFNKKLVGKEPIDWLSLYEQRYNFADSGKQELIAGYVINALIIQQMEKEKGFAPVMELLQCGPQEKGDAHYFAALEKLAGIDRAHFNTEVEKLVK